LELGVSARRAAILLLPIALAACEEGRSNGYTADRSRPVPQQLPRLLAFMKAYLNNPAGVHDAATAEPVQRTVGGRLRSTPRESDGSCREPRERAILYVDGRLDRVAENAGEACAGAAYTPFPDREKMTRAGGKATITFWRGLNPVIAMIDQGTVANMVWWAKKRLAMEQKRCCGAVTVTNHHGSGIATKQPN
jgi:hypothetical protein